MNTSMTSLCSTRKIDSFSLLVISDVTGTRNSGCIEWPEIWVLSTPFGNQNPDLEYLIWVLKAHFKVTWLAEKWASQTQYWVQLETQVSGITRSIIIFLWCLGAMFNIRLARCKNDDVQNATRIVISFLISHWLTM